VLIVETAFEKATGASVYGKPTKVYFAENPEDEVSGKFK
jgi:hypothetical protein